MEIEMNPASARHQLLQSQELSSQTLESMLVCTKPQPEKKPRPVEQAQKCPRCDSTNTKFCYYNNYSLTQPRYFCKSCRRYWTKGGTLRNVPVGGGCRKNKRHSSSSQTSSSSSSPSSKRAPQDHNAFLVPSDHNPMFCGLTHSPYDPAAAAAPDLSLTFARLQCQASGHLGFDLDLLGSANNAHGNYFLGNQGHLFLNSLRGGFLENAPARFQGAFYANGPGNGEMGNLEYGGVFNPGEEIRTNTYNDQENPSGGSAAAATVKQDSCGGREGDGRAFWGFPRGEGGMGEVDSGRQIGWGNGIGSTWHGLLNSPLM